MKPSREEALFVLSPAEPVFSPDGSVIGARRAIGNSYLWRAPSWERIDAIEAKQRPTERE